MSVDFPQLFGSFTENVSAAFPQVIRKFSVAFLDQQQVIRKFSEGYLKANVSTGTSSRCPFSRTAPPFRDGTVPLARHSVLTRLFLLRSLGLALPGFARSLLLRRFALAGRFALTLLLKAPSGPGTQWLILIP